MKVRLIAIFHLIVFSAAILSQTEHPYASNEPMPMPKKFTIPGSIHAWHITFEPDGNRFYFVADSAGSFEVIKSSYRDNDKWSYPGITEFSGYEHMETPFVSPDGNKFFFAKNITPGLHDNESIFVMTKTDTGWSEPENVAQINSPVFDASPSTSTNGNLYFLSERSGSLKIYCARWNGTGYDSPELIENNINRFDARELFIAPDESYILFGCCMPGDNWGDIYISFRNNNSWTLGRSIGPKVNTLIWEGRPCVSPDGNYLFFSRGGDWNTNPWQIYQVDWKPMLDSLRNISIPTDVGESNKTGAEIFLLNQNYPNPFNPITNIEFQIPYAGFVSLIIYDTLGNEIKTFVDRETSEGNYKTSFDGSIHTSGIYFVN